MLLCKHTIAKLEDELGVQLLSRNHSKITPTEAAEKLLPLIQEVVDADRRVMEFAGMIRSDRVGAVRIGGLRAASMRWIPGILRKMQAVAPGISVQPTMNRYEETIGDLLEGRVDVAFCEEPANRDLIYMRVIDDPYMVILPEHHSLASSGQLGLSDLKGKTLIIPEWPVEDNFGDVETAKKIRDMVSCRIQDERTIMQSKNLSKPLLNTSRRSASAKPHTRSLFEKFEHQTCPHRASLVFFLIFPVALW